MTEKEDLSLLVKDSLAYASRASAAEPSAYVRILARSPSRRRGEGRAVASPIVVVAFTRERLSHTMVDLYSVHTGETESHDGRFVPISVNTEIGTRPI